MKSNKISHAYLFSGPRGIGKTTVARILAKNLNCQNLKEGGSCGKCEICRAYIKGENMDLIEIDAASNRGIDEIRELIEKIRFTPTRSKYKVFIIDEAHMLTKEAWNALLKTLEEPPSHAIFVLVTTEPHKVPATIHSRCQRLDFRKISTADMVERLREIARAEKILIEDLALSEIIRNARGGLRDAISLLDQIQTFVGKKISIGDIEMLLGITNKKVSEEFLNNLYYGNGQAVFLQIEQLSEEGADLEQFVEELINLARIGLKIKLELARQLEGDLGKDRVGELESYFENFNLGRLLKILQILIEVRRQMKNSDIIELPLELAVLELEKDSETKTDKKKEQITPLVKTAKSKESAPDFEKIKENWLVILENLKTRNHSLFSLLKSMIPLEIEDNQLILGTNFKFYKERIMQNRNREIVCEVFQEVLKSPLGMKVKIMEQGDQKESQDTLEIINQKHKHSEEKFLENIEEVFEKE